MTDMNTQIEEIETCLSSETNQSLSEISSTLPQVYCPVAFDGFHCWKPTLPGKTVKIPCPTVKGSDSTYTAFRKCGDTGKWLNKEGVASEVGWTNYTSCFTPEIRDLMKRLGSHDEAQTKLNIAVNTRILELVGLFLSLTALVLSLLIFYKFRTLRNNRTRLHRHLFIAMVIQVAIRLTLYIDQAITRAGAVPSELFSQENLRGIDNTPILCETAYVFLEYARTCMFFWMFGEGMYLHNMITVTVFEEKLSPLIFFIVGWIFPIPLTLTWAIVTAINYGSATCWWGYNFTVYFWILEGPRLGVLMVNFAFLLNILRVLVTKLRRSNSSEIDQVRKAVKAALLLLPLLGLTNLLNMLHAPLEKSAWVFGIWSYSTHLLTSFQGLILACLYCFGNGEVQVVVKKYIRAKILCRNKLRLPRSSVRMSLLNPVVAQVENENRNNMGMRRGGVLRSIAQKPIPVQADQFIQEKFNHSKNGNNNNMGIASLNNSNDEQSCANSNESVSENTSPSPQDSIKMIRSVHGLRFLFLHNKVDSQNGICTIGSTNNGCVKQNGEYEDSIIKLETNVTVNPSYQ